MDTVHHLDQFVSFFKILAEPNRLRIVGLLSNRPHTVEQLSEALGIRVSTASHHLAKLADAGLVGAKAESHYRVYSLRPDKLTALAKSLLSEVERPNASATQEGDEFERKVKRTFLSPDGGIKTFPMQEKKFHVLLRHVVRAFEPGVRYPEKRVNQILGQFNEDTARLRRALVDHRYMAREGGGGKYWRTDAVNEVHGRSRA